MPHSIVDAALYTYATIAAVLASMLGWLQRVVNHFSSLSNDVHDPEDPISSAMTVHSEPQRHRVAMASGSNLNGNFRFATSDLEDMYRASAMSSSRKISELTAGLDAVKQDVTELQVGHAVQTRDIAVNKLKINVIGEEVKKLKHENKILNKQMEEQGKKTEVVEKKTEVVEKKTEEHAQCFVVICTTVVALLFCCGVIPSIGRTIITSYY